jgi:hypothetical protein
MTAPAEHLTVETGDRGFARLPAIPGTYGGEATVYESSAALEPRIWLNVEVPADLSNPTGPTVEATLHLDAEEAWKLADQIRHLVSNHYQGDATPDWA